MDVDVDAAGAGAEVHAADSRRAGAIGPGAASPSWRGIWALWFVAVALVALVAVPAYFGREVADAQTQIADVLEPAVRLSSNLMLLQSRQMARMEGFLLTGDRVTFRQPYIAAIAEKDSMVAELRGLAGEIDVEVFERVARLFNDWARWDFDNQQIFESSPDAAARTRTVATYQSLQQATRELNRAIESAVEVGRQEMADAAALQSRLTFALAFVALLGTIIVGRVGYRYRELVLERELRRRDAVRARREIDSLLEATGDGVLGIDLDGRCISLNRAGSKLLGYTESEISGRDVHDTLFHSAPDGSPKPRGRSRLLEALAAGEPLDSGAEAVLWRRKSIPFPARWSLRPLLDGIELRGAVLTFTDMTEIREKEEALHRAIHQREDVVSIVSHDLRNPLGVVLAAADLLLDLPLDEEQRRRQAEIIMRSGRRMQSLIEDLLDVAKIEAGALVVRPSVENLVPILDEAAQVFADQAEREGIEIVIHVGEGDPTARVDRDRIMQALANLLDNALRLTPGGGRVTMGLEDLGSEISLTVSDTGPGIDAEMLEHLFDRFHQSADQGRGGAGLGLAIVQGVTVAHGGTIAVQSHVGEGATFTLVFPKAGPMIGENGVTKGLV
jgi:PAS domain S-box-containing protein